MAKAPKRQNHPGMVWQFHERLQISVEHLLPFIQRKLEDWNDIVSEEDEENPFGIDLGDPDSRHGSKPDLVKLAKTKEPFSIDAFVYQRGESIFDVEKAGVFQFYPLAPAKTILRIRKQVLNNTAKNQFVEKSFIFLGFFVLLYDGQGFLLEWVLSLFPGSNKPEHIVPELLKTNPALKAELPSRELHRLVQTQYVNTNIASSEFGRARLLKPGPREEISDEALIDFVRHLESLKPVVPMLEELLEHRFGTKPDGRLSMSKSNFYARVRKLREQGKI